MPTESKYEINKEVGDRLEATFTYHAPHTDQAERYVALRDKAKELAYLIASSTPPSREQDIALDKLSETVMNANAAIARHEPQPEPVAA